MREGEGQGGCHQVLKNTQAKYMKESDFDLRVSLIIGRVGWDRNGGGEFYCTQMTHSETMVKKIATLFLSQKHHSSWEAL